MTVGETRQHSSNLDDMDPTLIRALPDEIKDVICKKFKNYKDIINFYIILQKPLSLHKFLYLFAENNSLPFKKLKLYQLVNIYTQLAGIFYAVYTSRHLFKEMSNAEMHNIFWHNYVERSCEINLLTDKKNNIRKCNNSKLKCINPISSGEIISIDHVSNMHILYHKTLDETKKEYLQIIDKDTNNIYGTIDINTLQLNMNDYIDILIMVNIEINYIVLIFIEVERTRYIFFKKDLSTNNVQSIDSIVENQRYVEDQDFYFVDRYVLIQTYMHDENGKYDLKIFYIMPNIDKVKKIQYLYPNDEKLYHIHLICYHQNSKTIILLNTHDNSTISLSNFNIDRQRPIYFTQHVIENIKNLYCQKIANTNKNKYQINFNEDLIYFQPLRNFRYKYKTMDCSEILWTLDEIFLKNVFFKEKTCVSDTKGNLFNHNTLFFENEFGIYNMINEDNCSFRNFFSKYDYFLMYDKFKNEIFFYIVKADLLSELYFKSYKLINI